MITWKCRETEVSQHYTFTSSDGQRLRARRVNGKVDGRFYRPVLLGLTLPSRLRSLRFPVKFTCPKRAMGTINEGASRFILKMQVEGDIGVGPCFLKFAPSSGAVPASLVQSLNSLTDPLRQRSKQHAKGIQDDSPAQRQPVRNEGTDAGAGTDRQGGGASDSGRTQPQPRRFGRRKGKKR